MGLCKGLACLGLIGGAGYATYRLGPWYNNNKAAPGSVSSEAELIADPSHSCDGCCNGLVSNCALPVNDVMFAMVHNAMSSRDHNFLAYNQLGSLEKALVAGYRGLMIDSCICDGSIGEDIQNFIAGKETSTTTMENNKGSVDGEYYLGFCHASCDAGVRDPHEVLGNIKTFLDVNPNEILLLEFEIIDNSLEELYAAIDASELDTYIYKQESASSAASSSSATTTYYYNQWPTMQSLIDANTRLIIFAHGDGMQTCTSGTCPEGIFFTYDHFEQTNWNDKTCTAKGEYFDTSIDFYLMNHWMNEAKTDLPYEENAKEFNTITALSDRYNLCTERKPNIVAVDFWSVGNVLDFVKQVNEQLGAGSSSSSSKGGGADTGGTITETLDVIESINESPPPPTETPTIMTDSYFPTYTPSLSHSH